MFSSSDHNRYKLNLFEITTKLDTVTKQRNKLEAALAKLERVSKALDHALALLNNLLVLRYYISLAHDGKAQGNLYFVACGEGGGAQICGLKN